MATRTRTTAKKSTKKTQVEINRIKPVGVLSLETMQEKSTRVTTINVQLPDKEVYQFNHLPVTVEQGKAFFEAKDESNLDAMIDLLAGILVNEKGEPLADAEALEKVDTKIITSLVNAIFDSSRDEGGED